MLVSLDKALLTAPLVALLLLACSHEDPKDKEAKTEAPPPSAAPAETASTTAAAADATTNLNGPPASDPGFSLSEPTWDAKDKSYHFELKVTGKSPVTLAKATLCAYDAKNALIGTNTGGPGFPKGLEPGGTYAMSSIIWDDKKSHRVETNKGVHVKVFASRAEFKGGSGPYVHDVACPASG